MRALAARLPFKLPLPTSPKLPIALFVLALFWTLGPRTLDAPRGAGGDHDHDLDQAGVPTVATTLERLARLPFLKPAGPAAAKLSPQERQEKETLATPPDLVLGPDDADRFCAHYHLQRHNASAWVPETRRPTTPRGPYHRRIYDLLLLTPTTSADMLQLRLASLYPYVDYFVLLEAPPAPATAGSPAAPPPGQGGPPVRRRAVGDDEEEEEEEGGLGDGAPPPLFSPDGEQQQQQDAPPSLLDRIWDTQLRAYHPKLIRHSLSQHSHDFKTGLDWTATTRNALYTRVIPLLNGQRAVRPGDVLLVADAEELVRPVAMKTLRNCDIPDRTTIHTRKYWYSYQWMQVARPGVTRYPEEPAPGAEGEQPQPQQLPLEDRARMLAAAAARRRLAAVGNEWWPHPQATVYRGAETVFPDDLRRNRKMDQYVFGDGGWTCHLCYPTIAETLLKLGDEEVIWFDGPRWKAAGRIVDRAMNGVEL